MEAFVVAPAGFLLAVLWFDLMFDVQVRRLPAPAGAVESIARYYRRVTTDARPMNLLVALAMLLTVAAIVVQVTTDPHWAAWASLLLIVGPVTLARLRTVPNAVRLGAATDAPDVMVALARTTLADHLFCFGAVAALIGVQLVSRFT